MRPAFAALLAAVAVVGSTSYVTPAAAQTVPGPPTVSTDDLRFTPWRTLRYGSAREVGLVPEHVAAIRVDAARFMEPSPTYPLYPGAVVLAAREGVIVTHEAMGHTLRYADDKPTELPRDQWIPMRRDTIFDMASVTKLFTSVATVQQVERGRIDLDAPVAQYIPEFAENGKSGVVVRQLLTHTSGLPAWMPLYRDYPTPEERIKAVYAVKPVAPPNTQYLYSDLGLITLGKVVEKVTGRPLDQVIADDITRPLRMTDTEFNPPEEEKQRIAATEWQPGIGRGMVWGRVHDENAWSLGGVAGHAGIFSTAHDMAIFAQMVVNGGRYGRVRILSEESVRAMLTEYNRAFPGDGRGLGWQLDQRWYMDAMNSPVTAGHTGFTGTSLVIDPLSRSFIILLSNRVHPSRSWGSNNPARRAVARDLGRALPVRPLAGRDAWFSGMVDNTTATLTLPAAQGSAKVTFGLWYDTEETDVGAFEASSDGGQTWQPVPLSLRSGQYTWSVEGTFSGFAGRRWARASALVPVGTTGLRWRYTTDSLSQGRGVYVDAVRIWDGQGALIFNGERPKDAARFVAEGWSASRN